MQQLSNKSNENYNNDPHKENRSNSSLKKEARKCEFAPNVLTPLNYFFDLIIYQMRGDRNLQKFIYCSEIIGISGI